MAFERRCDSIMTPHMRRIDVSAGMSQGLGRRDMFIRGFTIVVKGSRDFSFVKCRTWLSLNIEVFEVTSLLKFWPGFSYDIILPVRKSREKQLQ